MRSFEFKLYARFRLCTHQTINPSKMSPVTRIEKEQEARLPAEIKTQSI